MSRDPGAWAWGRIHRVTLKNPTLGRSGVGAVEALFNREDAAAPGSGTTVRALGWDSPTGYTPNFGSSMRMLVDLGDADAGRWVNQSGASGHPYGPYYSDQAALWLTDRTWPMVLTLSLIHI